MDNQDRKYERRFPRIYLERSPRPLEFLFGAQVIWPGGENLKITDLSHIGAAVVRPGKFSGEVGDQVRVVVELQDERSFSVESTIARLTERLIGLHFENLQTDARQALERFLHAKLIGLNMRPVDSKHFSATGGFTHWFHGPGNTNIFLWYESMTLRQAMVELGNQFVSLSGGKLFFGQAKQFLDSAEDDYALPISNSEIAASANELRQGMSTLMRQVLDVLSQVNDPEHVLQPFIEILLAHRTAE